MKKIIAVSHRTKNGTLDDDYTLYDNGEILHEYDKHIYPGGFNLSETLSPDQLTPDVKNRLINAASAEDKDFVRKILGIEE